LVVSDPDVVELSNLQRQIIHDSTQLGCAKVISAQHRLEALNPDVKVRTLGHTLSDAQWRDEANAASVVVVCTDNHESRLAANQVCLSTQTPWVYAAASGWSGQLACFDPRRADSACFACLYPQHPGHEAHCVDMGVAGPLVGVLGSLQALEAFKFITGAGTPLHNQLMMVDTFNPQWQTLSFHRQAHCACNTAAEPSLWKT
jgi:molybdopterin/thiamine biosynthesis adenylyltransferase